MKKYYKNIILFIFFINCIFAFCQEQYFSNRDFYEKIETMKQENLMPWLKNQDSITKKVIRNIEGRELILQRLKEIDKEKSFSITHLNVIEGDIYFYVKKLPKESVGKLYMRKEFKGEEKLLYDPTNFRKESKELYLINYVKPSWDGKNVVVSLTKNDEEISELIIINTKSKKREGRALDHCWPSGVGGINWLPDNSGFIYVYIPNINKQSDQFLLNNYSVLYKLSSRKCTNVLSINSHGIKASKEDFLTINTISKDSQYLIARVGKVGFKDYYYTSISDVNKEIVIWKPLFKREDHISKLICSKDEVYFLSSKGETSYVYKKGLGKSLLKKIVEEDQSVIKDFVVTKKGIFYIKVKNGVDANLYYSFKSKEKLIRLPKQSGSILISSLERDSENIWIEIEGWTNNLSRYKYSVKNNLFMEENFMSIISYDFMNNIEVKEIEVKSHDGVLVPLSIILKKGTRLNNRNRVLISGYGAYGYTYRPSASNTVLNWLAEGGIYAVAHVRGGGEKGNAWHEAGKKQKKSNTWKDFIACTEYLIREGYTNPSKIAAWSASAGGILIGRAITERPELYQVTIVKSGSLNMSRSEFFPGGKSHVSEFGSMENTSESEFLLEMDAFLHIKDGESYPAIFLTGGMNDGRVFIYEPAKFAARMQEVTTSGRPVLLSVDFDGGHGFEATQDKKNKELTDILSFALWQTGHPDYQLKENIDSK